MSNGTSDNTGSSSGGSPSDPGSNTSVPMPPDPLRVGVAAAVGGLIGGLVGALIGTGIVG